VLNTHQETVLYSFEGPLDGADPVGGLVQDSNGNLYGVAYRGGPDNYGTLFEVDPTADKFMVLHTFLNPPSNGWGPAGTLVMDAAGDLFGTTYAGGSGMEWGTVFEYSAVGVFSNLKSFNPGGALPRAGLYLAAGKLYGTTSGDDQEKSAGTVYEVGVTEPLYRFRGDGDGAQPMGGVIGDGEGNLYGTASTGGSGRFGMGNGVVFEVNIATGAETVLHTFTGAPDGSDPTAGLARDSQGNLYGTTSLGGLFEFGTVFELSPTGLNPPSPAYNLTILYNFTGGADGANPIAGVSVDANGNLWGAASAGGSGFGTLFVLSPAI
jgi:uncharacterized repeat protein (TIGR03803 family)